MTSGFPTSQTMRIVSIVKITAATSIVKMLHFYLSYFMCTPVPRNPDLLILTFLVGLSYTNVSQRLEILSLDLRES